MYTHACVCVREHIFMRKCSSHLVTRAGLCRQPPPKKRPTVSIYKFPTIDSVPNTHKTHAGQVLLYHYTQDKCGTSSPLPLHTSVGQVLLYHYTQDKSGTSSPLPPRTRQVQVKFSFTTTHKTSVGQVIIIIDCFYIYIKFSFSLYHRTHLQDKFSFTITHKTKAGHVLFYHLFICYCSTCSTHRWLTIYPLTTYSTVTSAHQ